MVTGQELIVFDCDGVLVDSEALVIEIESAMLTEAGFPLTVDEVAQTCVGLSYPDMMTMLGERFGRPVPHELSERIQREALAAFPERLTALPGMVDLLAGLAARDVPRCVASGSDVDRIELSLDVTDLAPYFEPSAIFSAEMVPRGKPFPDLFLHAADRLDRDPAACLVIEDSPHGVTAAVAAGMPVIGLVAGGHARPGLADRLLAAGAERVVETVEELAVHLGR